MYCTATFPNNAVISQTYTGTFNITANYCGSSTTCSSTGPTYVFGGGFTSRAIAIVLTTTSSTTTTTTTTTTASSTVASTTVAATTTITTSTSGVGTLYLSALTQAWGLGGPISSGNFITFNTVTDTVANVITFNGVGPYAMVISPGGKYAYVEELSETGCAINPCATSVSLGNSIAVINLATDTVVNTITLPGNMGYNSYGSLGWSESPEPIILSPDGSRLYVGYDNAVGGQLATINTATYAIGNTISLGSWGPGQLAQTPDGSLIYVSGTEGSIVTPSQNIAVINTATDTIANTISCLPLNGYQKCVDAFTLPSGNSAYAVNEYGYNELTAINTLTQSAASLYGPSSSVYEFPTYEATTSDGRYLYVENTWYGVDVVNTETNVVTNTISGMPDEFIWQMAMGSNNILDIINTGSQLNYIVAVNTITNKIITTSPATPAVQFNAAAEGEDGYGMMAISPDGTYAYLTGGIENSILVLNTLTGNRVITVPLTDLPVWISAVPTTPPLAISLSPLSNTIYEGQSVTFTNMTSGGTAPYTFSYTTNAVAGTYSITGNSITFNTAGTYSVTESVQDHAGNNANSQTAVITVLKPYDIYINSYNALYTINTATNLVTNTILFPITPGAGLTGMALSSNGGSLYIGYWDPAEIFTVSTATDTITNTIYLGPYTELGGGCCQVFTAPGSSSLYAVEDSVSGNYLFTINTATDTITHTMNLNSAYYIVSSALTPNGQNLYMTEAVNNKLLEANVIAQTLSNPLTLGNDYSALNISTSGLHLYATTLDQSVSPNNLVYVINPSTNLVTNSLALSPISALSDIVTSPNGQYGYVVYLYQNGVASEGAAKFLTSTGAVVNQIALPSDRVFDVALSPDGNTLYVTGWNPSQPYTASGQLFQINATTFQITNTISMLSNGGEGPGVPIAVIAPN
jgi:DNA-binding beta-propeller fold protein YncE